MALQATEQGSYPPVAAAANPGLPRQPTVAVPPSFPTGGVVVACPKRRAAAGLPDEMLLEILSCLPLKPLFRCKCVSKSWLGLVADCLAKVPPTLQGFFYWHRKRKAGSCKRKRLYFRDLLGQSAAPPVDPSFPFLTELPEIEQIKFRDSCNGLVLFRHIWRSDSGSTRDYIVCNPVTKEWMAVPCPDLTRCESIQDGDMEKMTTMTRMVFDPAVSSRFELVQFSEKDQDVFLVHTYSSESRAWSARATECWSHETIEACLGSTFVNGMIHLSVLLHPDGYRNVIVAVDGKGEKRRVIRWPEEERGILVFLGQSQGNLHCMSGHSDEMDRIFELSIWVLEDYGTEQWILKGSVNSMQLFGEVNLCLYEAPATIHPDRSLAFFFHCFNKKLVSYDMDSKEVTALCTLEHGSTPMTPYAPLFRGVFGAC